MLESVSEYFYDPEFFWAFPLVLVALRAVVCRVRAWLRQHR
jgi:hypothetical protein